jgi:N-acetylmuramoyl-L-alanine amidase
VKFPSILACTLSLVLISTPALARRLQSAQFDANTNRLIFSTDEAVQPRARLLFNPTRLVIDLPGTSFDRRLLTQQLGGAIREFRVGRLDRRTTRLVIELNPGFTLDPQSIVFRGISPRQWMVQLPPAQRIDQPTANTAASVGIAATLEPSANASSNANIPSSVTQIQDIQVTPDGFFIRTTGPNPEVKLRQNGDRAVEIDIAGATLSPRLSRRELLVNRFGVSRLQITQIQDSPPLARVTLELSEPNANWQATLSPLGVGGVVLLPATATPQQVAGNRQLVKIESVELSPNQLVIRANQPFTYTSSWDRATGLYRIVLPNARLDDDVREPRTNRNSPVLRVRVRQEDSSTVVILVQPASGIQIGELNQPSPQLLALPLGSSRTVLIPPNRNTRDPRTFVGSPPVPSPIDDGRMIVVIDPGHGGRDPGAIGIGGLREVDVLTPISFQVARILEQNGVQVVLTRRGDYFVDLAPRVQLARRVNADLFVSIHANAISMRRPDVNGIEVYHFGRGEQLARYIHRSILSSVSIGDRGVRRARFFVLRNNPMPAVLVEVGFVTGASDASKLSDPSFRSQMADAIARGILQYIRDNFPGSIR